MKPTKPEDLFRAEKERALTVRNSQHARLLAEAKAAFDKLMAEGQAARKSGRPRKHPLPPLKTSSARPPMAPPTSPRPMVVATVPAPAPASKPAAPASAAKVAKPAKPAAAKKSAPAKSKPKAKAKSKKR